MTFMMFTSATGSNPVQLGLDHRRIGATLLSEARTTRLSASQSIAAGEGTGALTVSSTWVSLADAVAGTNKFRAHPDVTASMAANDAVQVSRRPGHQQGDRHGMTLRTSTSRTEAH
jgi:hypothetical protein